MLILLPPSETKRQGGTGRSLSPGTLSFPALDPQRRALVGAVVALAGDADATIAALKLGPKQHAEVETNRALRRAATMPAIDRYTGVLFDALDAQSLSTAERAFAGRHVAVHSALFGLIGALDPIPAYRLSHDSRVPELPLKRHWSASVSAQLAEHDGLILDLRSEGYAKLGPAPTDGRVRYVRVLTEAEGGTRRALNHFNKKAKGAFSRALIQSGIDFSDVTELLDWAARGGIRLEDADGELALIV
ncbi:hypothetical protein SAMN04489806_2477 [Paramicrobacterium humi]|uniref:Peroxide stress protein YaaA n=1 Tax=Paramicrobacterium humi TaxID=640635 RepID=A0A1H4PEI3_9MICO|nr:peroxide stress protein YaaA [Microbacterium humi]SEC05668.1 hypothetical protein SAMN04489806_2477 [Microbacterium humi]